MWTCVWSHVNLQGAVAAEHLETETTAMFEHRRRVLTSHRISCRVWLPYHRHVRRLTYTEHTSTFIHHIGRINEPTSCKYAPAPASWPLTFWPWKWCPSHVWRGLPLCQLVFLGLSLLDLGPMYATDVRQTSDAHHRLCPLPLGRGIISTKHRQTHTHKYTYYLNFKKTLYIQQLYTLPLYIHYIHLYSPWTVANRYRSKNLNYLNKIKLN